MDIALSPKDAARLPEMQLQCAQCLGRSTECKCKFNVVYPECSDRVSLRNDQGYLQFKAAESQWPQKYTLSQTQPSNPRRAIWGLTNVGVGPQSVATYNSLVTNNSTRTKRLKSEQFINTEVYGTAPYLGLGDGVMRDVHNSNELILGNPQLRGQRSKYLIADQAPNQWQNLLGVPLPVPPSPAQQGGVSARDAPVYVGV